MKRGYVICLLLCFLSGIAILNADNERPLRMEQLPKKIQDFVTLYFPNAKLALAKVEEEHFNCEYDLIFTDGNKIEFYCNGDWKEIKCKRNFVPLEVLPEKIVAFLSNNYPDVQVLQAERTKKHYKLKLSNRWKLKFDKNGCLIDADH